MIVLGLTGGIGVGKSYIANKFKELGVPTYNSDDRAKYLMNNHAEIKKALINKFGELVFQNNELNSKLIANKIFNNKQLINWINSLVHPIVANDFDVWRSKQQCKFIIKEAAILIESGAYKQCDKVVVITAPENIRVKRVTERDNMTPAEVKVRMNNQLSDNERKKYADFLINNDGTVVVDEQVKIIYNKINSSII